MLKNNIQDNVILAFAGMVSNIDTDAISLGKELTDLGCDLLTDAGFFVWQINTSLEYYSNNFRKALGFENELDFPNTPDSWQKYIDPKDLLIALKNYEKSLDDSKKHPYTQDVTYSTKTGDKLRVKCSGFIITVKEKSKYLIGTHKLLK